ncbi:class I SAM-dependent methyltransferase [Pseudarthrobacter sp. NamB4]|uniref:class I SAM-dependent methyltransferase n=1 Tax=Pseudarthrobacter sp. NamB4 TaxID=2576837 RepID=UPI00210396B6|nr:methyltransferase domain-containing protein [Pseudarthrobacter sp. NamB4]
MATAKAAAAPVPVTVPRAAAEHLHAEEASADAVVASLVLCSVSAQAPVLAEIRRVLRPGGTFAFYERVRSDRRFSPPSRTCWLRLAVVCRGCHPNRDTVAAIEAAGFAPVTTRRLNFAVHPLSPPVAHVLGAAVSPGPPASS